MRKFYSLFILLVAQVWKNIFKVTEYIIIFTDTPKDRKNKKYEEKLKRKNDEDIICDRKP